MLKKKGIGLAMRVAFLVLALVLVFPICEKSADLSNTVKADLCEEKREKSDSVSDVSLLSNNEKTAPKASEAYIIGMLGEEYAARRGGETIANKSLAKLISEI